MAKKYEHWWPRQGERMPICPLYARHNAKGQLIMTGRNGWTHYFVTPILNSEPGGPTHMLIAAQSEGPPADAKAECSE
jgi:hypothetical protein